MILLENIPQDIKSARDYKPCAPDFFRWVVLGGYGVVLLSVLIWGFCVLREGQQDTVASKDKKQLEEIKKKIADIKSQGAKDKDIKERYENWNNWLKGNYTMSSFLLDLYKCLPQETRLQEFSLKEAPGESGQFDMMMRFFSHGENSVPNTDDFEEKLTAMGVELQDRQQSVGEGGRMEISAGIALPGRYYQAGAPNERAGSFAPPPPAQAQPGKPAEKTAIEATSKKEAAK